MRPALVPELRLLLELVRQAVAPDRPPPAPAAVAAADPSRLVELAAVHGGLPLLAAALADGRLDPDGAGWSAAARRRVLAARDALALRLLLFEAALGEILDLLAAHDLPVLPLKGPVLRERFYPPGLLRGYADLDLLVPPARLGEAAERLERLGYRPDFPGALAAADAADAMHAPPLRRGAVTVELHRRLFTLGLREEPAADGAWARRVRGELLGRPAELLGPEDLLLHLAVHAARHSFAAGLRDLLDLGLVVAAGGAAAPDARRLDWDRLLALPEARPAAACLFDALALAAHYAAAPVPPAVLAELWGRLDGRRRRVSRRIRRGFFRRPRAGLVTALERLLQKPAPLAALGRFLRPTRAEVARDFGHAPWLGRLFHPAWRLARLARLVTPAQDRVKRGRGPALLPRQED